VTAGQYGFDFGNTADAGNALFYFRLDGASGTSYGGGTAYSTGGNDGLGISVATLREIDRTFLISFTPVLEPTSFGLMMLGSLGMLTLRRRR
jgi:hypothetical protein